MAGFRMSGSDPCGVSKTLCAVVAACCGHGGGGGPHDPHLFPVLCRVRRPARRLPGCHAGHRVRHAVHPALLARLPPVHRAIRSGAPSTRCEPCFRDSGIFQPSRLLQFVQPTFRNDELKSGVSPSRANQCNPGNPRLFIPPQRRKPCTDELGVGWPQSASKSRPTPPSLHQTTYHIPYTIFTIYIQMYIYHMYVHDIHT